MALMCSLTFSNEQVVASELEEVPPCCSWGGPAMSASSAVQISRANRRLEEAPGLAVWKRKGRWRVGRQRKLSKLRSLLINAGSFLFFSALYDVYKIDTLL